ncbi:hypothetical protein F441_16280 [Phytophthora nicotianae CJ01A1]|uniref:Uncharacterized protein n=6 Tax=Phytophthora nicotianae TaxID=4792 RepID=W2PQX8_PHYN3|nr:hypothetical protein PPTG_16067 [Phytophthora nicotianae INRA-310]ETI37577.1 hypothetical protein F443_16451 [Phytophthora nicotianae P1569]ETK77820.1 hypothetical protein L915_15986 [Phytophthora nicotianae]ETO66372.1 hypothetical protein F444_16420 [Phytophthora nicotianae P1976]ETP07442.1 hypothetical protein F441_16280 [Phytophthora nicotianae CJ01A1]ETP35517.1 hypothetical protein F442_16293 [Phytophthora nicotianae P10297]KUF91587.1 hypothetical protein AM587_10011655 [Phytophthora n
MNCTTSVQARIDQFELMAQTNAKSGIPHIGPMTRLKIDNSLVKEIINRLDAQHTPTHSEFLQMMFEELAEEPTEKEQDIAPTKPVVYKSLMVNTLQSDNEDDDTAFNSYEDESVAESTTSFKSTRYSGVPRSPSTYSTASTSSLDSLLSSLDMFVPELLQASGRASPDFNKNVKPTVYRSRRTSFPENLQVTEVHHQRATLKETPLITTNESSIPAPKARRSSLYTSKKPASVAPRSRCSSFSAAKVPPTTEVACSTPPVVPPHRAKSHSNSSPVARYMDYESSPRFAAMRAMNVERRRRLEERNRALATAKSKRRYSKPRTPEWQKGLDQIHTQVFACKQNNQSHSAKTESTISRRHSTSTYPRG